MYMQRTIRTCIWPERNLGTFRVTSTIRPGVPGRGRHSRNAHSRARAAAHAGNDLEQVVGRSPVLPGSSGAACGLLSHRIIMSPNKRLSDQP